MNNLPQPAIEIIGDCITNAVLDFYREHGKDAKYAMQEQLFHQSDSKKIFRDSWEIEVPGSTVFEVQRFDDNGNPCWYANYINVLNDILFITCVKYWANKAPEVSMHAFPFPI